MRMDRRGDSRGRDLEINMPGLCDQWDMSGKVKEKYREMIGTQVFRVFYSKVGLFLSC